MKYGPIVFLSAFFALASSWFGLVLTPQLRLGHMQQTNAVPSGALYPVARPGLAQQGLQVYRENGCAYCHTRQATQTTTVFDVVLAEPGTNQAATVAALQGVAPRLSRPEALDLLQGLPKPVLKSLSKERADAAAKAINTSGARANLWVAPAGPDIARGWAKRRSVAEDYLYDSPVLLGAQRIGPDLANVGVRQPDENWHLRHLFAPSAVVAGSTMPPYPYLFEKRRVARAPSPDALALPKEAAPEPGYEIVPTEKGRALAAFLTSLRSETPLYVAPLSVAAAPPAAGTNVPAGANDAAGANVSTNAPNP